MRIGQYYMQTFVGGNTSECSEFDQIIHNFSEQQVDDCRSFLYSGFLILATIFLFLLNWLISKQITQEYRTYKALKSLQNTSPSTPSANSIEIPNIPHPSATPQSANLISFSSST
ncbi:unnamed protein product [Moneuplotes crassus]|nr:unnamed protein product [Moneuplotes crassus]